MAAQICAKCGAPLVPSNNLAALTVRCDYCGTEQPLADAAARRQQLYAEQAAAQQYAMQQQVMAQVTASVGSGLRTGRRIGLIVTVVTLLIVGATVVPVVLRAMSLTGFSPFGWNGQQPLLCSGNDTVTLDGVTANLPGTTVVRAYGNCELTLSNSTLSGNVAVEAAGNAHVHLVNCRMTAASVGVMAGGNAQVVVGGGSLVGGVAAAQAQGNAHVEGMAAIGGAVQGFGNGRVTLVGQ
jgi:hypothetical protein